MSHSEEIVSLGLTALPDDWEVKIEPTLFGGWHAAIAFPNGRGASVIHHEYSHDVELAVLGFDGRLDYSTPITNDVIGWETRESLLEHLHAVAALPSHGETAEPSPVTPAEQFIADAYGFDADDEHNVYGLLNMMLNNGTLGAEDIISLVEAALVKGKR